MSVGAHGVFPRSLKTPVGNDGGSGGRVYNGRKRNKSVAKWEYSSGCMLCCYHPSLVEVKTFVRASETEKNISLGIQFCNLSDFISISNRTVRVGVTKKKKRIFSTLSILPCTYPISVYLCNQTQPTIPTTQAYLFFFHSQNNYFKFFFIPNDYSFKMYM